MLERCLQRRDTRGLAVAAALASVLPPPLDDVAHRVTAELRRSVTGPAWLDAVGQAEPTRAWIASDVFGDQDSLIVGFAYAGREREHALIVLVDHNLSGQAKDAWIAGDLDEAVRMWESNSDHHMRVQEAPIDEALALLFDAMAMADLWSGDGELRTEEFAQNRALCWARLRRAGLRSARPDPPEVPRAERDAIVADFLVSGPGQALAGDAPDADVELLAHYLVDLRCDYEGRPFRWSPNVVGRILTDLAPRKLLLDGDQVEAFPSVFRAFVRFSAERTALGEVFVSEILATVDEVEREFRDLIGDPGAAGPAKAVLAALRARGVDSATSTPSTRHSRTSGR